MTEPNATERTVIERYVKRNVGDPCTGTVNEYLRNLACFAFDTALSVRDSGANLAYAESLHDAGCLVRIVTPCLARNRRIGERNAYQRHL